MEPQLNIGVSLIDAMTHKWVVCNSKVFNLIALIRFRSTALDLKKGAIYEGNPEEGVKPDTTLSVTDTDLVDIALGKLNPQVAFMKGKLKITGNIMLTQKLVPLLKTEAKL